MDIYQKRSSSIFGFTFPDFIFVVFVICTLVAVGFLGAEAYHEAKKTEDAKKYGEDISAWLTQASKDRFNKDYPHHACAGGTPPVASSTEIKPADIPPPVVAEASEASTGNTAEAPASSENTSEPNAKAEAPEPIAGTWGACLKYMLTETEFKDIINTFLGETPQFVPACNPADHSLAGAVFIEKMVPTPPGSAVPVVNSPLAETDAIDQKMQLRLSVCDKGAYPLKIAEFEF
jgi:hypothetical protein